jgi:hypothetical protein
MDTAQFLIDLRVQRDRINDAIAALESLTVNGISKPAAKYAVKTAKPAKSAKTASVAPASTKRVVSPEGRLRMAEAQQKRWAKKKRAVKSAAKKAATVAPVATKSAKTAAVTSPAAKKVGKPMSEATKKKLAVAAKARWAAKSAGKAATAKA